MCELLVEGMEVGGCGISAQILGSEGNVQLDHDGTPMVTDLMSGVLHSVIMGSSGNLVGASAQGRVRLLAVEGPRRSEVFPDVPTFEEAGLPGIRAPVWFGIVAPAGTPRPIVDKISRDLIRITGTAVFREKVIGAGREPGGSTPEAFATLIRDTTALWAPIVKAANITLE